jgi:arylsulfatase A-like enzyme
MIQKKLLIAVVIALFIITGCTSKEDKSQKPNIVFILADDLGYGDVSCFNENSKIATPNIDALAANGVMFTDAHTSSAVCTPTRYGILTGRYNWRTTLKRGVLWGYSKALIAQDRKTVAGLLKDNGYITAGFGKWHLGWDWAQNTSDSAAFKVDFSKKVENGPITRGFDYFFGFPASLDIAPYVWLENDMPTMVPTKTTENKGEQSWWRKGPTSDDFIHEQVLPTIKDKTVEFIRKNANGEKPFFIYMPLSAPHTPILPTKEFQGKSGLDNPYGDFVIMVDWVVGEVRKALEEQGVTKNTLLIFTSDNGCSPQAGYEQLAAKGHNPSFVFRGHKADIFEGGHRVPYIVSWPAKVKQGKTDQLLCTTDLFATVADIIGVKYNDNVAEDSYSFLPALNLKSDATVRKSIIHHSVNGNFAYRKENWKAIFCPGSGGWSYPHPNSKETENLPKVQLYNLADDIGETTNLQAEHADIVEQYRKEMAEIVTSGRSTKGAPQKNDGPEKWKQLDWIEQ